jgi:hypothetical protein
MRLTALNHPRDALNHWFAALIGPPESLNASRGSLKRPLASLDRPLA